MHHASVAVEQLEAQGVERRCLACPFVGVGHVFGELHRVLSLAVHAEAVGCHLLHPRALRVGQGGTHGVCAGCILIFLHIDIELHRCVAILIVEVGGHKPVKQACLRGGIECHVVEDSGQSPVVLSLEVVAVAVFHHTHGQRVLAGLQIRRHVVFGWLLSTFVISHLFSVHPHERCALGLLHAQEHLASVPLAWQSECLAICTCGVILSRHPWRIGFERGRYVAKLRVAKSLHLPVARNGYVAPFAVFEAWHEEFLWHLFGGGGKVEAPLSVERHVVVGLVVGMTFLLTLFKHRGVLYIVVYMFQILGICLKHGCSYQTYCKQLSFHIVYYIYPTSSSRYKNRLMLFFGVFSNSCCMTFIPAICS